MQGWRADTSLHIKYVDDVGRVHVASDEYPEVELNTAWVRQGIVFTPLGEDEQ